MKIGEIDINKLCTAHGYVLLQFIILKEYDTSDIHFRIKNVGIYKVISDDSAPEGNDYLGCNAMIHEDNVFQVQNYIYAAKRKDIIAILSIEEDILGIL